MQRKAAIWVTGHSAHRLQAELKPLPASSRSTYTSVNWPPGLITGGAQVKDATPHPKSLANLTEAVRKKVKGTVIEINKVSTKLTEEFDPTHEDANRGVEPGTRAHVLHRCSELERGNSLHRLPGLIAYLKANPRAFAFPSQAEAEGVGARIVKRPVFNFALNDIIEKYQELLREEGAVGMWLGQDPDDKEDTEDNNEQQEKGLNWQPNWLKYFGDNH
ncbi:hypothetical protein PM082_011895 [Marasmius tenuissimus]|nr:hypothetical protein PM082_011895 [Marasmius tenuissimus]